MKSQRVKQRSKIAKSRERAPWRTGAQRGAGGPVEHPHRHHRSRAVWHLADRHPLTATVVRVHDGDALPDQRMPGVMNFATVTDTGRMKRSLSSADRFTPAHARCAAPRSPRFSIRCAKPPSWSAWTRTRVCSARAPRPLRGQAPSRFPKISSRPGRTHSFPHVSEESALRSQRGEHHGARRGHTLLPPYMASELRAENLAETRPQAQATSNRGGFMPWRCGGCAGAWRSSPVAWRGWIVARVASGSWASTTRRGCSAVAGRPACLQRVSDR